MDISNSRDAPQPPAGSQDRQPDRAWLSHPAVQIYSWICLSLAVQMLSGYMLLVAAGILIGYAFRISPLRYILLLRRTRWILVSMFVIYAYITPGEPLLPQLGSFSPVSDGIMDGLVQLTRLLAVLAGLSILLSLLSQAQLVAGLYSLFRPLCLLGLSREQFAVRLALSLRYAERAMQESSSHWRDSIEHMLAPSQVEPGYIELRVRSLSWPDWVQVVAVAVALLGVWLLVGGWR